MSTRWTRQTDIRIDRRGLLARRDFLKGISLTGIAAGGALTDMVSLQAEELRRQGKSCILLWMQGGPSQFETFSPKPGHENGGETKAIDTSVSGIQIADNFPHLAKKMEDVAIIRSMTTKEGNHQRASYLLHTSYVPTATLSHPTMGSVVSSELVHQAGDLPAFVRIGRRAPNSGGGGFLGSNYDPFSVDQAGRAPNNAQPTTPVARFQRRLGLLNSLEGSGESAISASVFQEDHKGLYDKTSRMILSPKMEAFDLEKEPNEIREAYGKTEFGSGCLLARRLIEAGVTFVEVGIGSWDTHQDNFTAVRRLAGQVDQPMAYLLTDLKQRGLLENTLVIWMGEFGRTPRINPRTGRDHYPRAFNAWLAGSGVRGGQVIGSTDEAGSEVADRPVSAQDLFQSVYTSLKINPMKELMSPIGRPIKLVDGGTVVNELFA